MKKQGFSLTILVFIVGCQSAPSVDLEMPALFGAQPAHASPWSSDEALPRRHLFYGEEGAFERPYSAFQNSAEGGLPLRNARQRGDIEGDDPQLAFADEFRSPRLGRNFYRNRGATRIDGDFYEDFPNKAIGGEFFRNRGATRIDKDFYDDFPNEAVGGGFPGNRGTLWIYGDVYENFLNEGSSTEFLENRRDHRAIVEYQADLTTLTLVHGGESRHALWSSAPHRDNTLKPLVIVLHGGGGTAAAAARRFRMHDLGQRENFHTLYPQGSTRSDGRASWNAGQRADLSNDDVGFIRVLIARLIRDYPVDPKRVYVTGFSAGGMMAYRVGCELSDQVAAIAPVAGALTFRECRPRRPIPLLHIHGRRDQNVPINGKSETSWRQNGYPSMDYALSQWRRFNGCEAESVAILPEYRNARCESMRGCSNDRVIAFCTVAEMGHQWPGARLTRRQIERGEMEVSGFEANVLIWNFFNARRLP